jgi:hypothetical protein
VSLKTIVSFVAPVKALRLEDHVSLAFKYLYTLLLEKTTYNSLTAPAVNSEIDFTVPAFIVAV